jgi:hypothetical protein
MGFTTSPQLLEYTDAEEISNCITQDCSEIFNPLLSYIFNISFLKWKFLILWKAATLVSDFEKCNSTLGDQ